MRENSTVGVRAWHRPRPQMRALKSECSEATDQLIRHRPLYVNTID